MQLPEFLWKLFFCVKGYLMDLIYQAAAKYVALQQYEYEFVLSHRRKNKENKAILFQEREYCLWRRYTVLDDED